MSIYSGFATRQQQHKYNSLLETLIVSMKKRLIKFYSNESCDEKKYKLLMKKIFKKMYIIQKGKFMAPKFSSCFTDLIDVLQIDINYDTMSDASSMISQTFSLNTEESNDPQLDSAGSKNNLLQSKNKLVVKKNLLQISRPNNFFSSSSFSLKKSHEDLVQPKNTTIDVFSLQTPTHSKQLLKPITKLKQMQQLKDLRAAESMPKVQDYLPRKDQLSNRQSSRQNVQQPLPPRQYKAPFRRHKYTRQDAQIEQI